MRKSSNEATYTLPELAPRSGSFNAAFDKLVMVKHLFDDGNLYAWLDDGCFLGILGVVQHNLQPFRAFYPVRLGFTPHNHHPIPSNA
jgi:hypothetical protein